MEYGNMSGNSIKKNKDYNSALINVDYIKIMQKAVSKYRKILDKEEVKSCQMIGLWKAMQNFDKNHGIKFTTFLYNIVRNECRKRLRQEPPISARINEYSTSKVENNSFFTEIVDSLDYPLNRIIELRYLGSMTIKEIGQELGMTKNNIRRNIQKAFKQIKKEWI